MSTETGQLQYFFMPAALAEVSSKNLIICATFVYFGIGVYWIFIDEVISVFRLFPKVIFLKAVPCLSLPLAGFILYYFLGEIFKGPMIAFFGFGILLAAWEFLMPLARGGASGYLEKLNSHWDSRANRRKANPGTIGTVAQSVGRRPVAVGLWAVTLVGITYGAGYRYARTQASFLVPVSDPNCAVIQTYGEELVCAEFEKASRRLTRRVKFIHLRDGATEFFSDDSGPLAGGFLEPLIQPKDLSQRPIHATPGNSLPKSAPKSAASCPAAPGSGP